jgi:hypothetical protein
VFVRVISWIVPSRNAGGNLENYPNSGPGFPIFGLQIECTDFCDKAQPFGDDASA